MNVKFLVTRIDGRASQGCPNVCPANTKIGAEIDFDHGRYCPDKLEEQRREMNEPRRRPERDIHEDVKLQNRHAEKPI